MRYNQPVKKRKQILFVFLVWTLVSSVSTITFVTGNVNLAFAKKQDSSSGSSGGGGSGSSDNGGGGSTDNTGGGPTTGESGGGTSNTPPPPPSTAEKTPSTQQTCPDGSAPTSDGTCPSPTPSPPPAPPSTKTTPSTATPPTTPSPAANQSEANAAQGGTPRVVPECITAPCNMAPGVPQTASPALSNQTAVPPGTPPLTPEQLYESCLQGIGGGIPGNCKPPTPTALSNQTAGLPVGNQTVTPQTTTSLVGNQTVAPQTLIPQYCPSPTYANGTCPGVDPRTGYLGQVGTPGYHMLPADGTGRLHTFPPIFGGAEGDILGRCPAGSHKIDLINKCVLDSEQCPPETHPVADLCSRLPPVEEPANPDGSCPAVVDTKTNKCYTDNEHAPPCPGGRIRGPIGLCDDPQTGIPVPAGPCSVSPGNEGVHIAYKNDQDVCFFQHIRPTADTGRPGGYVSCQTGYFLTGETCSLKIQDPLPDASCPAGYHNIPAPTAPVPGGTLCKLDLLKLTNDDITSELPGGYCPTGYRHDIGNSNSQLKCFRR